MMPNSDAAAMGNNDALVGNGSGSVGFTSVALKKGPWTAAEDAILMEYVKKHGEGNWNAVQKNAGLSRCGKSCRLRWANHLRPNLRKGSFSSDEERLILELHSKLGNKWARMAAQLPGRTDNEIKNYWNTRVKRHQRAGLPLYPQDIKKQAVAFNVNENNQTFPSPSQPLQQQQQQPKSNFGSPLSMFDPVNFPVTSPFLTAPLYSRFKRFRDNNNNSSSHGFSLPFSATPAPPPPLFPQFQFAPLHGNFDFNPLPPPMLATPFEINTGSPFSMKMELPSNQLPQPADTATAASGTTANSGLLDALLGESQAIVGSDNSRRDGFFYEKYGLDGLVNANDASQRDDSSSAHSSPGLKRKKEGTDEINSAVDEDLNSLLDIMYSNSGEISNGQSSGVTDDEIGLEMQQLASSMSAPNTTNPDWTSWNKLPGIC